MVLNNSEWKAKLFKDLIRLDRGSSPRPIVNFITESNDGVNWIKIGDTSKESLYINSTKQKITPEGAKKSRRVSKGEIILSNSMSYGQPYILNIDGCIHDGWFVLRDYDDSFDKSYLLQYLGSELIQNQYKRLAAGGVVSNISSELVYSVKANVPPLPEQQKIAKILSTWDKAISTTERLVENSTQQKKALMQQLLTGKKRLLDDEGKRFEGEWEPVRLGEVSDVRDGTHDSPEFIDVGYPLITSKNLLSSGRLDLSNVKFISEEDYLQINKRSSVNDGDILFGMIGTIGNPVKVKSSNYAIKNVALIKEKADLLNKFLIYYLSSHDIKKQIYRLNAGGTQKFVALGVLRNLTVKLPTQKEQQKIATVLTNADKEIELLQQQLADLQQEKKALMQVLLTGKKRVKLND